MFHRSSHTQRSSCETPVGNNYKPFSGGHLLQRDKDEVAFSNFSDKCSLSLSSALLY